MFEKENQFYPTPARLADKVAIAADLSSTDRVLDPLAGSGALLDAAVRVRRHINTYAIEIDPELRYLLAGKGYRVVGSNFLDYCEPVKYSKILMNPPFAHTEKMILRAYELLEDGGILVSIVNTSCLHNVNTKSRERLGRLVSEIGEVEGLGAAFSNAERQTDVDTSLVVLRKPKQVERESWGFDSANFTHETLDTEDFRANPLAHTDAIKTLVARYKIVEGILLKRHSAQQEIDFYLKGIYSYSQVCQSRSNDGDPIKQAHDIHVQIADLKYRFWKTVFTKTAIRERSVSTFQKKFDDFARNQSRMEFNEQNIKEVLSLFFNNRDQIILDAMCDVFDKITRYHHKNIAEHEGWAANKTAKINKKIIHPHCLSFDKYFGLSLDHGHSDVFLEDLDKCLCFLSAERFSRITPIAKAIRDFLSGEGKYDYQQKFESTFFVIRVFKKGTVHLTFKDQNLLKDFNLAVAKAKGGQRIGSDH